MTCPACGNALAPGQERCAFCGALVAPTVEGALAPDQAPVTPAGRGRADSLREIGGHRKRERTWKDEVNDRVRNRRQVKKPGDLPKGAASDLPLFGDGAPARDSAEVPSFPNEGPPLSAEEAPEIVEDAELSTPASSAAPWTDLPLHPAPVPRGLPEPLPPPRVIDPLEPANLPGEIARAGRVDALALDEEPLVSSDESDWPLELAARSQPAPPVERPAFARERAMAAGLDLGLMLGVALVVVYFAGRAARVPLHGLRPAWPWLMGYLALLGLVYAGYFTGTTGQTPGKMATGLRVVDRAGHPPGFLRAFARGSLGALGVALAGLGLLPMVFDPARRALHDRVFRMRVVRR